MELSNDPLVEIRCLLEEPHRRIDSRTIIIVGRSFGTNRNHEHYQGTLR